MAFVSGLAAARVCCSEPVVLSGIASDGFLGRLCPPFRCRAEVILGAMDVRDVRSGLGRVSRPYTNICLVAITGLRVQSI